MKMRKTSGWQSHFLAAVTPANPHTAQLFGKAVMGTARGSAITHSEDFQTIL